MSSKLSPDQLKALHAGKSRSASTKARAVVEALRALAPIKPRTLAELFGKKNDI